jgi:chromosome segregation ATPase
MSYVNGLKLRPRRHPVQHKSGQEAIRELNTIVDQANARIAHALGQAGHYERVAREAAAEMERLQAELDEARQEAARLRAENDKLRRKLTVKAGQKKRAPISLDDD